MAARPKTGGRTKGTPNRAKTPPSGTQAEGVEAPAPLYFLPSARAREGKVDKAVSGGRDLLSTFPRHRIVEVENLVPYARNARTHTAAQIDKIAVSIREFGFTNPVLTDGKGGVIAGHGRVLAAAKLGMATVPTVELSHLTAEQRRAYVLADNRLALDAGWDSDLLAEELSALRDAGFDLALTGFDGDELSRLFAAGRGDPDLVPEVPVDVVSVAGDVWQLGEHRLYCGDADELIGAMSADAVLTDPPYGLGKKMKGGTWGATAQYGELRAWDVAPSAEMLGQLLRFKAAILWGGNYFALPPSRCWLIWDKQNAVRTTADAELGWTSFDPDGADCDMAWSSLDRPVKRLSLPVGVHSTGHPTQKPSALIEWSLSFLKGETILDPYLGSGTTLIACETASRRCVGIEKLPAYVDVAVLRWQAFTGQSAVLEADGLSYDQVCKARCKVEPGKGRRA